MIFNKEGRKREPLKDVLNEWGVQQKDSMWFLRREGCVKQGGSSRQIDRVEERRRGTTGGVLTHKQQEGTAHNESCRFVSKRTGFLSS